jgi:hypothetical protein
LTELGLEAKGKEMRFVACVVLFVASNSCPVSAAPEQCLSIKSGIDRQACYDRQASDSTERRKSGLSANPTLVVDPIEKLKVEDDRLSKRLQGICRGC